MELYEVNDDAAWELSQDSVAFQDSQFADGLMDEAPSQTQPTTPEVTAPFIDAFSSAHKSLRRDVAHLDGFKFPQYEFR